ncbi:carboxypeptidase regulatory-like domain-containing protein, partial [Flavobacterium sp. J49]|uniref:SdrD B-like domain-containing protein n=2 Tax=Flavobacterium sp. J49 TaxID=2718534 RepID=UPI0015933AEC
MSKITSRWQGFKTKSVLLFLVFQLLLFASNSVAQTAVIQDPPCTGNIIPIVNGQTIQFKGVLYNYPQVGQSTWLYSVKGATSGNGISHTVFGLGLNCLNVVSNNGSLAAGTWSLNNGTYSLSQNNVATIVNPDPTTGAIGIKFDEGINNNVTKNYYFVVNGNYLPQLNTFISKYGTSSSSVQICGPSCIQNLGSIGNFVWNDTNANGIQDSGETGIAGVTVQLLNSSNVVIATTTTNANGNYLFSGLIAGTYTVTFSTPNCYLSSPASTPISTVNNSDAVGGVVSNIVLAVGQNITYVDAGFYLPSPPQVLCYQTATWNPVSCQYDVTGTQPEAPQVLCYQTATWNPVSCQYDITGTQPEAPQVLCYQTATWNPVSCQYDVTGTQPEAPQVLCYQTATWNPVSCQYDVTGTQPEAPQVLCYQTATWNPVSCQYDVTGT